MDFTAFGEFHLCTHHHHLHSTHITTSHQLPPPPPLALFKPSPPFHIPHFLCAAFFSAPNSPIHTASITIKVPSSRLPSKNQLNLQTRTTFKVCRIPLHNLARPPPRVDLFALPPALPRPYLPAAGGNTKADRASADHSAAEGGELGEAGAGATFYFTLPPLSFGRWKIAGQTRKGGGNGRSRGWSRDTRRASEGRGTVITRMVPWETQLLFVVCTPEACFPNCHRVSAQTTFSLPLFSFFAQLRNFPPFPLPPATTFSLSSSPPSSAFFSLTVPKQRLIGSS